jgi:thiamine-phosphate pyrophosphorylase
MRMSLADARLYFVCGARPGGRPLEDVLRPALAEGVDVFQLREKDDPLRAADTARALCDEAGVPFILNDRPDLVDAARADGVHVGQDDAPVAQARAAVGEERIVGLSTHSEAQVDAVEGVDYFAVGPVHATPTKEGRPAIGLGPIRHAAATATAPWFAIGGIDERTVHEVLDAGAARIVVVRAIAEADEPAAATRTLRKALDGAA